ncbi:PF04393 family protein [Selenomonas sp. FOBRC9]|uniref:VirK/YbjX family protein n=1 Tax=Selenomonas sp. FOBRC9 TaxID=936573 RepID=UPI00027A574F|nr:VirK/YbjX family protein [Selenomonas sp. FOBRC9]EJP30278.1 PF04393 family protein [Selenomonas sp. FOBRC9]
MLAEIYDVARRAYRFNHLREGRRAIVFMLRAALNWNELRELYQFFHENEVRAELYARNPYMIEQATRAFFYAGSTVGSRIRLIQAHYAFLEEKLNAERFIHLGLDGIHELWRSPEDDIEWRAYLKFEPGQRKEGLLSVIMDVDGVHLYQIIFWLDLRDGEPVLVIGAMQGPNTDDAQDFVREMTKRAHRFRTKNLILFITQVVARALGVRHIFAVSNAGYYANNHVRRDRKLKTDFGAFWEEVGGHLTEDHRFYELPLTLHRKTIEEIPTRKRAVYRRRFRMLDEIDAEVMHHMQGILN